MKKSYFRIALAAMCMAMCAMVQAAAPPIAADSLLAVAYTQVESKQSPTVVAAALKSEAPVPAAKSTGKTRRMWASIIEPADHIYTASVNGLLAERPGSIRHRRQPYF